MLDVDMIVEKVSFILSFFLKGLSTSVSTKVVGCIYKQLKRDFWLEYAK